MAKVTDILKSIPMGGTITDKRVLAVLKRAGIIYDYSEFGYLESQWAYYKTEYDGKIEIWHELTYNGVEIKEGDKGSHSNPFESYSELSKAGYGTSMRKAEYKGYTFDTKYLSGCFNAYLVKRGGECTTDKVANPTMSLWGQIV